MSGKDLHREGILEAVFMLQKGDTLIVTNIDRIAGNVREDIQLLDELLERGVILHILNMGVFDNFQHPSPNLNITLTRMRL